MANQCPKCGAKRSYIMLAGKISHESSFYECGTSVNIAVRDDVQSDKCKIEVSLREVKRLKESNAKLLEACETIELLGKSRYHDLGIDKMVQNAIAFAKARGK